MEKDSPIQRPKASEGSYGKPAEQVTPQTMKDFREAAETAIQNEILRTTGDQLLFKHFKPRDVQAALDELSETLKPGTNTKSIEAWVHVLEGQDEVINVCEKLRQGKY